MRYQLKLLGSYLPREWADCESQPDETVAEACKRWLLEAHKLTNGVIRVKWTDAIGKENVHDLVLGPPLDFPGYTHTNIRDLVLDLVYEAEALMKQCSHGEILKSSAPYTAFTQNLKIFAKALEEERQGRRGFTGETRPTQMLSVLFGGAGKQPGNRTANFSKHYSFGPEAFQRAVEREALVPKLATLLQEAMSFDSYPGADEEDPIPESLIEDRSLWERKWAELGVRVEAALKVAESER